MSKDTTALSQFKLSKMHIFCLAKSIRNTLLLILFWQMLGITSVHANETGVVLYDRAPSAHELADTLFPPKTRSIIIDNEQDENLAGVEIAFVINFEFDSTNILQNSMSYLDSLGNMLNYKRLKNKSLMIEGHADAKGNSQYNLKLSEKRAKAIKRYLVSVHNIDASRLYTLGQGEDELLDPRRPYSNVNRRAEFKSWVAEK